LEPIGILSKAVARYIAGGRGKSELETGTNHVGFRLEPPSSIKFTSPHIPAKDLRDFDIEEMGCMNGFVGVEKPFGHLSSGRSIQQHLDHDRGINNDHRPSRSALTALAGETVGVIEDR
jgi:hypothetical protein